MIFNNKKFDQLKQVITCSEGGVFKRIDENRELAEMLVKEAPDLIEQFPWIRGWLLSQDAFLNKLATSIDAQTPFTHREFPRKIPECIEKYPQ